MVVGEHVYITFTDDPSYTDFKIVNDDDSYHTTSMYKLGTSRTCDFVYNLESSQRFVCSATNSKTGTVESKTLFVNVIPH